MSCQIEKAAGFVRLSEKSVTYEYVYLLVFDTPEPVPTLFGEEEVKLTLENAINAARMRFSRRCRYKLTD